ncbi:UNVERIFIED_CONTAM: Pro-Pol polyprotein [Sesamum latifolium]|uniref:Pro-Pol polyprotein n=1 Tax=Sesamum latifolium TaxID=2727402 RepID=A0AAW2XML6_9LAMI
MENSGNTTNKQKAPETSTSAQALQVVTGPMADPPRRSTSSDTSAEEISPALLGAIQQIVSAATREQVAALAPTRVATPSDVEAPEEEAEEAIPAPVSPTDRRLEAPTPVPQEVPPHWLARLEYLQKGLQDVQCQIGGSPEDERQGVPFTKTVMVDELSMNCRTSAITKYDGTTDPVEHLARLENATLLHSRKLRKTELSLFVVRQKKNEPLKEYLQRFNTAALEVPSATQEVKASAFSQRLLDGDFFKSLAKKPVSKFDALLARAAKYINMEDAQAAKKESRGEKRKEVKEEAHSKKPRNEFREKKATYQRINTVHTPLTEGHQRPQSDKFCHFHNNYGHTTEECRHLKNEIERLIQNGYLQEYVCWEKARGTGPYQKKETDKSKEAKVANPEASPKGDPKMGTNEKTNSNDPPRKGVIRMITGGPIGGDSHHARKAEVRKAHDETIREVLDVEAADDTPIIQFGRAEHSGPKSSHNDALVITALLENYKVGRVFIDSGSSADILFGDAYDQMQLGDIPLEKVNTSLYGFVGEVVHPRGLISLPLTLGTGPPEGHQISYSGKGWRSTGRPLQSRRCYVKAVRKGQRIGSHEALKEAPSDKRGRDGDTEEDSEADRGTPPKVQQAEELLNIELIPGDSEKVTRIGSQMDEAIQKEIIQCLRRNTDIFAWTPQDLKGIDPEVITHYLNIDPRIKLVKQKKKHFSPEKDKIIQVEIDKLVAVGHVEEIQFPEWLSNVVLVPKPSGKWRMCIDFRDLNKACPKDFYPLPRIDQLVDSTSGCELLSVMDASQGYHQIMLAPEDRKRVSFITSAGTFCYVAMPFGLKNGGQHINA